MSQPITDDRYLCIRGALMPDEQDFENVSREYRLWTELPKPTTATTTVFVQLAQMRDCFQRTLDAVCRRTFSSPPPVYLGHYYRHELNAVAFRHPRGHFIGINAGVHNVLNGVFQRLLSTPYFFPNIGDVAKEAGSTPRADVLGSSLTDENMQRNLGHQPNCPIRRGCVGLFAHLAFDFILLHELGHHSRGHLYAVRELTGIDVYSEFASDNDRLQCDTYHAIELDADRFAMSSLFYSVVQMSDLRQNSPDAWRAALEHPEVALEIAAAAVYTVFRLFARNHPLDLDDLCCGTHPHPLVRLVHGQTPLRQVLSHYHERFGMWPDLHLTILAGAHKIFEEALELITLSEPAVHASEFNDPRAFGRLRHLEEEFECRLRPKLFTHFWTYLHREPVDVAAGSADAEP